MTEARITLMCWGPRVEHAASTALARNGNSDPLGKLTAEVKTFKVDEETAEGLDKLAREAGHKTRTEFMREASQILVHGAERLKSLHTARIDFIAGKLRE